MSKDAKSHCDEKRRKKKQLIAINSLLEKSDLSHEHREIIRHSLLALIDIKRNLQKITDEAPLLPERRNAANDAIRYADDLITCIAITTSKTDVKYAIDIHTGKYILAKREADISAEIKALTDAPLVPDS